MDTGVYVRGVNFDKDDIIIDIVGEVWRPILDLESFYEVSNKGRVKGVYRKILCKNGITITKFLKLLVLTLDKDGYNTASLKVDNKSYCKRVCRLVAIAFIDNPLNLPQVNHIDCVKSNDDLVNLEWMSNAQNQRHRFTKESTYTNIVGVHKAGRTGAGIYISTYCISNTEYILGRCKDKDRLKALYDKTVYEYEVLGILPKLYVGMRDRKNKKKIDVPENIRVETKNYLKLDNH